MFKTCDSGNCRNWAQWKVEWPDKTKYFFCAEHLKTVREQIEQMEAEERKKMKIHFCGVIPIQHVGS